MSTERTGFNNLTVEAYIGFSTSPRTDPAGDLARAERIRFQTQYPAGLYADAEFFVPRDPAAGWPLAGNDRLVIRNGLDVAWEGAVGKVGYVAGQGATQGRTVYGTGWWGRIAQQRGWHKPWADNRLSPDVWQETASPYSATDVSTCRLFTLDRLNRLRFEPKTASYAGSWFQRVFYRPPLGEPVRRLKLSASLNESTACWLFRANNGDSGSVIFDLDASGSLAVDQTLGAAACMINLYMQAETAQTMTTSGCGIYAQAASLMVYTETGIINACAIACDIVDHVSGINADYSQIGNTCLVLEPFITDGYEMIGNILLRAAAYGDASFYAWAPYFNHSETAQTPTGEPVLVLERQPLLNDYDYAVRLDDPNLVPPLEIIQDNDAIYNYIIVRYRDELANRDVYITPEDNSSLTDNTSVTAYGFHSYRYDAGLSTAAGALSLGKRLLASRKDPRFYAAAPITVRGYIRGKNGNPVPASLIRAGKRVRVENYLTDEVGLSEAGLTFLITGTSYNDTDETCSLACGVPNTLDVVVAQMAARRDLN